MTRAVIEDVAPGSITSLNLALQRNRDEGDAAHERCLYKLARHHGHEARLQEPKYEQADPNVPLIRLGREGEMGCAGVGVCERRSDGLTEERGPGIYRIWGATSACLRSLPQRSF